MIIPFVKLFYTFSKLKIDIFNSINSKRQTITEVQKLSLLKHFNNKLIT